jgi:parvulin-like peptidyl-prolyl isomerase
VSQRHHAAFLALSLTTLLAACSNGGPTIVSVNGTTVTKAELDHRLDINRTIAHQQLGDIIEGLALDQYAKAHNFAISEAEIAQARAKLAAGYRPGGLEEWIRQNGLSEDDFNSLIRRRLIVEHAIGDKNAITQKQIADFFKANPYGFNRPEQVHARQILVRDLAAAKTIEAKLKAGGDFAALASLYSTDLPSRAHGGDLGYFGGGDVLPEVRDAAFAQQVGAIGPPVKSSVGYHIIQVLDHRPAQRARLAAVRDKVRDRIWQIKVARETPAVLQNIMSNVQVTVYDPAFSDMPDAIRKSGGSPQ